MKKAKEIFDDLAERIKKGEKVSFGQMENVFAQAFLSRFLQRLSSEQERQRANKFYQEHLVDQEALEEYYQQEEPDNMSSDQQIHYELEVARSIMGTLGVRPSTADLSYYIENAVRSRDWKLLDKVLSLTQEGGMGKGVIEKVALEDLVRGRETSFTELKEHFGDMQFSEAMVRPLYEEALRERNFEGIGRVRNETHLSVPEELCGGIYESLLENFSERTIPQLEALRQATDVSPERTEKVRTNLIKVFSGTDVAPQVIDALDGFFGIYAQKANSPMFQRAALDNGHLRAFEHLYTRSEGKIAEVRLKEKYKEWDAERKYEELAYVVEMTGVSPSGNILDNVFNYLCGQIGRVRNAELFGRMSGLIERTSKKPEFEQEKVDQVLNEVKEAARGTNPLHSDVRGFLDVLKLSKNGLDEKIVQDVGLEFFRNSGRYRSFEDSYKMVQEFFSAYKVKAPTEITSVAVSHLVADFTKQFGELERECKKGPSPLQPLKGTNLKEYHKFSGQVAQLARRYTKLAKDITKRAEGTTMQDSSAIQEAYTKGLELILVQCERNEENPLNITELQKAVGVPISTGSVAAALSQHILRYVGFCESQDGLLEKLGRVIGMEIRLEPGAVNQLAMNLLREEDLLHMGDYSLRLDYLTKLTSAAQFSAETKERIKAIATRALVNGRIQNYDTLVKHLDERFQFSGEQIGALKAAARKILRERPISLYDELQERVQERLVDTAEVSSIASDMLDLSNAPSAYAQVDFSRYDQLKDKFGLGQDFTDDEKRRIRERAISKLKENPVLYRNVKALNQRTGFTLTATPEELRKIIDGYFELRGCTKPQELATSLNQQLDAEQIQKRYIRLIERARNEPGTAYEARELKKDTGISLTDGVVRNFISWKRLPETIQWLEQFNSWLGYTPGQEYRVALFREAVENNSHDGIKDLIGICGARPDYDFVRDIVLREHKPIDERIKWLRTFTDISAGFFELTPAESNELYRQAYTPQNPSIRNVGTLMHVTKSTPPEGISRQILDQSMQRRSYGLISYGWEDKENRAVDEVVASLTGEHKVKLRDDQATQLNEYLSQRTSLKSVAETIACMSSKYHVNPELTEEQQRRVLQAVEQVVSQAYTRIKKSGELPSTYYGQEKFSMSVLFTHDAIKQETAARAAELLASENIFQGLVYMRSTGATPNFTPEQFNVFKQGTETYQNRFSQEQLVMLKSVAEKLKPAEVQ